MSLRFLSQTPQRLGIFLAATAVVVSACAETPPADHARVSGEVETTEVQVASLVPGRILELPVVEGVRVEAGALIAKLDTADADLALARARADRDSATAQLRLVQAGARPEDIRQAEAQVSAAQAEVSAVQAEASAAAADLAATDVDVERFEALVASNSGSRKQRDDAVARRNVARERAQAARERVEAARGRVRAAEEGVARLRAGARREEVDVARTRVVAAERQMAVWEKTIADATVNAPVAGVITQKLADAGEIAQPRVPLVVIADIDHAWANLYVAEPDVPRIRIGQTATLFTDAGGQGIPGLVSYISDKAEFTPRNIQTAEDRSKLVYRVKVTVDNTAGVLKAGMPVEAEIPFAR